jgi:1,4-alpha-glucan branching enzyme
MTTFQVWAPSATTMVLVLGDERLPMLRVEDGWWGVEVPTARHGADYALVVDGSTPLPDPRWPWQPGGVHGYSRVVDQQAFAWHDATWQQPPLSSAVFYELHVGTFTPAGTFFGALADFAKTLRHAYVYDGRYSAQRRRRRGRPTTGLSGHCFLGFLQNHDQIGNRARGERSSHLLSPERLKIAAALVCTAPFLPLLFQGEEWGATTPFQYFTNHADPELGRAVSEGRRAEFAAFGWAPEEIPDPQALETFTGSKLSWPERHQEPHASLLEWHRRLLRLRRQLPALADGRLEHVKVRYDETARWLLLERGPLTVGCNLAAQSQRLPLRPDCPGHILLAATAEIEVAAGYLTLPPDTVAILGPGAAA